jgi:hypothetical protein
MKEYWVKYLVTGECIIQVQANDPDEAKEKADKIIYDKEFGDIDEVEDIEAKYIEDENGDKVEEYW